MGIRSAIAKPFASYIASLNKKWITNPIHCQQTIFYRLLKKGRKTIFGKDHDFGSISDYETFKKHVPIRDYEALSPYVNKVIEGQSDVLWQGHPIYLTKTSGTTSGAKYIPITRDSISNHIFGARDALLSYVHETGKTSFLDTQWIFLSGSPKLERKNKIKIGRLSGIINHHVPAYLRLNQCPSYATNCIVDWEKKVEAIVSETLIKNMGVISGIPPWVQMYFDRIQERTGKPIADVFPNFSLLVHGGVNVEPYWTKMSDSIGKHIDTIELYPASEGFIAYQDSQHEEGMLLCLNEGIFFEFIPLQEYSSKNPSRLCLEEVKTNTNYAVIINSNAGLWGYALGDTVKFVSKNPYRIIVTGRINHYLSAFGEHVIGEEVEKAMRVALKRFPGVQVVEFTVAPQVAPASGLPHHEWCVEFAKPPTDAGLFAETLDMLVREYNIYYDDLIRGKVLKPLSLTWMPRGTFIGYMKSLGKLGGQNKMPRLSNDRKIVNQLIKLTHAKTRFN